MMCGDAEWPCVVCEHPMRGPRAKAADHPGTRVRRVGDTCDKCYQAAICNLQPEPYTVAGLTSFLRRRRAREDMMNRREMYLCHPSRSRKQVRA